MTGDEVKQKMELLADNARRYDQWKPLLEYVEEVSKEVDHLRLTVQVLSKSVVDSKS